MVCSTNRQSINEVLGSANVEQRAKGSLDDGNFDGSKKWWTRRRRGRDSRDVCSRAMRACCRRI